MPEVSPFKMLYELGDMPVPGYTVTRYIGAGSFGQVWEATGPGDVQVAIKILNFGGAGQEREFKAIELVKRIRNPFLVPIFGIWLKDRQGQFVGEANLYGSQAPDQYALSTARDTDWSAIDGETSTGDTVYLPDSATTDAAKDSSAVQMIVAMGLGETSLHDRLRENHGEERVGIAAEKLLEYMEQVAQGIDYLNLQCGIIHRDIKPHNMLLVGDVAQVCDFGLAKRSDDIYNTIANMLTAAYCAPEAFDAGCQPTPAMDQYALAISYYELRTGNLPFSSSSITSVMKTKLTGTLSFDCVPPEEAGILRRATSVDPQQRFSSCREFIRALRDQYSAAILPSPPAPPSAASSSASVNKHARRALATQSESGWQAADFQLTRGQWFWSIGGITLIALLLAVISKADAIRAALSKETTQARRIRETNGNPAPEKPPQPTPEKTELPKEPLPAPVALPEVENSLGMKFVVCPPGSFEMGSPASDMDASDNEQPALPVTFAVGFQLSKHEITQRDWKHVMQTEPWQGKEFVFPSDDSPASYVSWNDAMAFCQKLTELERTAGALQPTEYYRLPTEAEWEYACRAGTKTRFSFDDQASQLGEYAWFGGSSTTGNTKQESYPHAVGTKQPNPWGLYDMHGNIREWCADIYKNKFSAKRETTTVNDDAMRVLRGGAWSDEATLCRAAARDWSSPTAAGRSFGFRVVREAAVPTKE